MKETFGCRNCWWVPPLNVFRTKYIQGHTSIYDWIAERLDHQIRNGWSIHEKANWPSGVHSCFSSSARYKGTNLLTYQ